MSPTTLLAVQFSFSLVLSALVARWYISPLLDARPVATGLVPLFLVHALRYLPTSAFAPGQVDPGVPADAMAAIAYGDLASAVLAFIAALFLYYRWQGAIGVAWVVNIVTSVDWLYAGYRAASSQLATYPLGGNWYIINYYVPVIGVIHVLIFARLLQAGRAAVVTSRMAV
jgi:hypothetical protein